MSDRTRLTHEEAVELAAPFVLNALEPDEEEAVREHLRACPLPHEEFAELGSVVPALAETLEPVEPPAALKGRILAAAADDLAERTVVPATAGAPAAAPPAAEPIQIDSRRRPSPVSWFLVAAAGIAIVALVAVNLLTLGRLNSSEQFERDVAAVLEAGSQPGRADRGPRTDRGRRSPWARGGQLVRRAHDGRAGSRSDDRQRGLRGLGDRR